MAELKYRAFLPKTLVGHNNYFNQTLSVSVCSSTQLFMFPSYFKTTVLYIELRTCGDNMKFLWPFNHNTYK